MGSLHSLHKFLPKLAEISAPVRPLLSQNNHFVWTPVCENAFQQLKSLVENIVELRQFDIHRETRIICDASHDGLGAVLEQYCASGWHPISFASRYLNTAEKKYSTNELELLAVVWATEHFRNYIYGRYFTVISDHKALLTLLNSSPKVNKTFFSRLTRWYDRLVPIDFKVEHRQGSKMGMADYLSRFPSAEAPETSHYDENFTVAMIRMINAALKPKDKMKPRGQKVNKIRPKPTVGVERSCFDTTKSVSSNENERKDEYANIHREHERSIEGVFTCNRRLTNQRRDICIPAEICKYRRKKFRRCSHCLNYSCKPSILNNYNRNPFILNNYNSKPPILKNYSSKPLILNNLSNLNDKNTSHSPEKNEPPTSAIVNTLTNSGNVNLNVVLNRLNQPPSVSLDSDIEMIPPEKLDKKQTNSKKLNTIISFHTSSPVYHTNLDRTTNGSILQCHQTVK